LRVRTIWAATGSARRLSTTVQIYTFSYAIEAKVRDLTCQILEVVEEILELDKDKFSFQVGVLGQVSDISPAPAYLHVNIWTINTFWSDSFPPGNSPGYSTRCPS
jgi:hypothetical protein